MIKKIEGLPEDVVALEAIGEITASDYENVVVPEVEARTEGGKKVKFIYVLGPQFEKFTAGAMWDDAKVGMKHLKSFEKIAVVTDHGMMSGMVKAMGVLIPCEVKVFTDAELDTAKQWIST